MKKFSLIIPKRKPIPTSIQITGRALCVIVLCLMCLNSSADVHDYGCRFGNRIFQIYDTTHPGSTNFQYDSDNNGFPNGFSNVNGRCQDPYSSTPCTIYNYDGTVRGTGVLSDFSIDYCPIDDYLPFLLLLSCSIAFQKIRKQKAPAELN
ncbi:hypothetical protein OQ268_15450 [Pedobacter sandarakinus]|nr:hypothetical protein [Pedobacter sandarakinus]